MFFTHTHSNAETIAELLEMDVTDFKTIENTQTNPSYSPEVNDKIRLSNLQRFVDIFMALLAHNESDIRHTRHYFFRKINMSSPSLFELLKAGEFQICQNNVQRLTRRMI